METLLEMHTKCCEYNQYILDTQRIMIENYLGKIYSLDGERYRVNLIDITGRWSGYPVVQLQSVREISHGMVKSKELTFEEFNELMKGKKWVCSNT
ncbi:hypothetical protein [Paenibacillus oleatilyticus]|uniref:hypothetical protein n=1 Tax=Paenibacillus oleatilyticus TaxID=2594886 RepID=UPI001C1F33D4|nr:hypothetical protein [Paenibacillus oleatilyticus]MBU7316024.1 hypothetical protein [Paenibacillus oleatilyticus]